MPNPDNNLTQEQRTERERMAARQALLNQRKEEDERIARENAIQDQRNKNAPMG